MGRADSDSGVTTVAVDASADATSTLVAGSAGQRIKVLGLLAGLDADGSVTFKSGTTALSGALPAGANIPFGFRSDLAFPFLLTAAGDDLKVTTVGGALRGFLTYYVEG